eukprot:15202760-Ditylum_brightwellii.AAC.1
MGCEVFQVDAHARAMEHGKMEGKKRKEEEYMQVKSEVESVFMPDQCRGMERSTKCLNQWFTVVPNAEHNSVLGKTSFATWSSCGTRFYPMVSPRYAMAVASATPCGMPCNAKQAA